jgi:hypothetical protein
MGILLFTKFRCDSIQNLCGPRTIKSVGTPEVCCIVMNGTMNNGMERVLKGEVVGGGRPSQLESGYLVFVRYCPNFSPER